METNFFSLQSKVSVRPRECLRVERESPQVHRTCGDDLFQMLHPHLHQWKCFGGTASQYRSVIKNVHTRVRVRDRWYGQFPEIIRVK